MSRIAAEITAALVGVVDDPLSEAADGTIVASAIFRFPASFCGFAGHFPGRPVLPAVAQLAAVVELARRATGRDLVLAAVERAKFSAPVGPETDLTIRVRLRPADGALTAEADLSVDGARAASCTLSLREHAP